MSSYLFYVYYKLHFTILVAGHSTIHSRACLQRTARARGLRPRDSLVRKGSPFFVSIEDPALSLTPSTKSERHSRPFGITVSARSVSSRRTYRRSSAATAEREIVTRKRAASRSYRLLFARARETRGAFVLFLSGARVSNVASQRSGRSRGGNSRRSIGTRRNPRTYTTETRRTATTTKRNESRHKIDRRRFIQRSSVLLLSKYDVSDGPSGSLSNYSDTPSRPFLEFRPSTPCSVICANNSIIIKCGLYAYNIHIYIFDTTLSNGQPRTSRKQ